MIATAVQHPDQARLADAFRLFTEASGHLEGAWARLQEQVGRLQSDLAAASAERDAARSAEADTARQLAWLLDALPAGVVLLDATGTLSRINDAARTMLGEPLLGTTWAAVLDRLMADGRARATGTGGDITLADGRRLRICERPVPSGDSILLITDVTSQRRLEDVLARHRRLAALGEMAATLAHQIRTPLSAALLYAGNAANTAVPEQRRGELLGRAMDCLQDLEQLVSDMLGFARGAGRPDTEVALHEIIDAVETAARPLLRHGQALVIDHAIPDLRLTGNRESLSGALLNLVSNALQAAGASARVTIAARGRGRSAEIAVTDNGPGVPAPLRERIFEPFFTSRSEGTGLGLAVVRSVAEAHGGSIRVEDRRVEDCAAPGACFVLSIPVTGSRLRRAAADTEQAA